MNLYEVLNVSPNASQADIRKKYLELVIKVHPDKHAQTDVKKTITAMEFDFHELQLAWKTLANPARRFLYDISTFGQSQLHPEQDESFLIQLRMTEAAREVERMSSSFQRLLSRESSSPKGLIVTLALYGSYEELLKASRRPLEPPIGLSRVVDVLIPVQCLVEVHKLILPGGKTRTKADLPGFYSPILPSEDIEAGLLIRYTFSGKMHQVIALDEDPVWMPKKSHVVNTDALAFGGGENIDISGAGITRRSNGPLSPGSQQQRQQQQQPGATKGSPTRQTANPDVPRDRSSSSSGFLPQSSFRIASPLLKFALQAASACVTVPAQWAHAVLMPHLSSSALSQMSPFFLFAACAIALSTAMSPGKTVMKVEVFSIKKLARV